MTTTTALVEFAADVRRDLQLTPKQLQSKYLYDALGSSLFEAICRLPWYRITRAENRLLHVHADEIVAALDTETVDDCRARDAAAAKSSSSSPRRCRLPAAQRACTSSTSRRRRSSRPSSGSRGCSTSRSSDISRPTKSGFAARPRARRTTGRCSCLLLGSNIGNFDAPAALSFLRRIRGVAAARRSAAARRRSGQARARLQLAYDDPLGVTAAFNKNLLVRINRELGGTFDLDAFEHRAAWNARRTADRDAPREPHGPDRRGSMPPASLYRSRAASTSGPRARTSTNRTRSSGWASRLRVRAARSVDRRRRAVCVVVDDERVTRPGGHGGNRLRPHRNLRQLPKVPTPSFRYATREHPSRVCRDR